MDRQKWDWYIHTSRHAKGDWQLSAARESQGQMLRWHLNLRPAPSRMRDPFLLYTGVQPLHCRRAEKKELNVLLFGKIKPHSVLNHWSELCFLHLYPQRQDQLLSRKRSTTCPSLSGCHNLFHGSVAYFSSMHDQAEHFESRINLLHQYLLLNKPAIF